MKTEDRIKLQAKQEGYELRYLTADMIVGFCANIFDRVNIARINPIPAEYSEAIIDGLVESFYNGCEPEFETEGQYNNYIATLDMIRSLEWVIPVSRWDSPYKDKTIPVLREKQTKTPISRWDSMFRNTK